MNTSTNTEPNQLDFFQFETPTGTVNWKSISKLDLEKIKKEKDIELLQSNLDNAVNSNLSENSMIFFNIF